MLISDHAEYLTNIDKGCEMPVGGVDMAEYSIKKFNEKIGLIAGGGGPAAVYSTIKVNGVMKGVGGID